MSRFFVLPILLILKSLRANEMIFDFIVGTICVNYELSSNTKYGSCVKTSINFSDKTDFYTRITLNSKKIFLGKTYEHKQLINKGLPIKLKLIDIDNDENIYQESYAMHKDKIMFNGNYTSQKDMQSESLICKELGSAFNSKITQLVNTLTIFIAKPITTLDKLYDKKSNWIFGINLGFMQINTNVHNKNEDIDKLYVSIYSQNKNIAMKCDPFHIQNIHKIEHQDLLIGTGSNMHLENELYILDIYANILINPIRKSSIIYKHIFLNQNGIVVIPRCTDSNSIGKLNMTSVAFDTSSHYFSLIQKSYLSAYVILNLNTKIPIRDNTYIAIDIEIGSVLNHYLNLNSSNEKSLDINLRPFYITTTYSLLVGACFIF